MILSSSSIERRKQLQTMQRASVRLQAGLTRRTWESQTAGDTRHNSGDEVVEVAKGGRGQLEGTEADVIQRLIVQDLCGQQQQRSAPRFHRVKMQAPKDRPE